MALSGVGLGSLSFCVSELGGRGPASESCVGSGVAISAAGGLMSSEAVAGDWWGENAAAAGGGLGVAGEASPELAAGVSLDWLASVMAPVTATVSTDVWLHAWFVAVVGSSSDAVDSSGGVGERGETGAGRSRAFTVSLSSILGPCPRAGCEDRSVRLCIRHIGLQRRSMTSSPALESFEGGGMSAAAGGKGSLPGEGGLGGVGWGSAVAELV